MDKSSEQKSNIVLIGMPGVGKSTVGVVLAKILNYDFVDADLAIQKACGQTLQEIIDERGVEGFIAAENSVLKDLAAQRTIISTGGSAVYSDEAMAHLQTIGHTVYLKVSCEELEHRLGDLDERGVVMRGENVHTLRDLYEERRPLYEQWAEVTVDTEGLSITQTARRIAAAFTS